MTAVTSQVLRLSGLDDIGVSGFGRNSLGVGVFGIQVLHVGTLRCHHFSGSVLICSGLGFGA